MKHETGLLTALLRRTGLPRELDPHRFFIQWIGSGELTVERHHGIVSFGSEQIRLSTEQGVLSVSGEGLVLEQLTDSTAKILGSVSSVTIEAKS